ncbi:MAG: metallophosphatase family protein [Actinomycetota bacterium]|nr:metallophosphatase family protein [Actinomycetota bacterium]
MSKRVGVISDVHGNWHALEATVGALKAEQPEEIWCLGDLVGYGPKPNECCAEVRHVAALCLVGNHDLLALDKTVLEGEFNPDAVAAGRWTRSVLDESAHAFLDGLRPEGARDGVELFHASPRDPVWDYVLTDQAALVSFELTTAPLVLVGHSHVPLAIGLENGDLSGGVAAGGTAVELAGGRWLLNPGSVGQPRDGDPRAAFLVLELGERATFHRVPYAVEKTQDEIREEGLPDALAERLAHGV